MVIHRREQERSCPVDLLPEEINTVKQFDTAKNDEEPTKRVQGKRNNITPHEEMPSLSIRFDGIQHMPNFDDRNERRGFRCKLKKCGKQTTVFCEKCNVHLCFVPGKTDRGRNCFKKFHQLHEN